MIGNIAILSVYLGLLATYMISIEKMLHIMQLEGYKGKDFINWLTKNLKVAFKEGVTQFLIVLLVTVSFMLIRAIMIKLDFKYIYISYNIEFFALVIGFYVSNGIIIYKRSKEMKIAKKPLVYTARVKRLVFSNFVIMLVLSLLFDGKFENDILMYSFLIAMIPINILIANWFISPTEQIINNHYINSAKRKINSKTYKNLIRIGITGSYGKTSTKFILQTILSEKYKVLATPESYNTTMGNVRTIREKLKPEHEVFISEMGARNIGDVKEICNFVKPQIGIITSIGPQHLETFKKIENVVKTKGELLQGLTKDGVAVLPKDNEYCYELYKNYTGGSDDEYSVIGMIQKIKSFATNNSKYTKYIYSMKEQGADVYVKNIELNEYGSTFIVCFNKGEFKCTTKLLGEHNIENILGCITIALHLGLTTDEISRGVSKVEAVQHRLQILPSANGTIVIDDAFNSNPVGSKMALDVLKRFNRRKIIITPGMVELGKDEYKYNKEFGEYMAESVDVAIIVGKNRSKPIVEGLKQKKFNDMNIYVVSDLTEATKKLSEVSKSGDVILFENDLPDNYNE